MIYLLFFIVDQISKYYVINRLVLHETITVNSFFNITHVYNTGSAFSFLSTQNGWQTYFFIVLALLFVAYGVYHTIKYPTLYWSNFAWGLISSGALGNMVDRIFYGHVVDFLSFHYQEHYFPVFNIADICIFMGALLMIYTTIKKQNLKNNT